MKKYVFSAVLFFTLISCEKSYLLETKVHPNGAIDKSITLLGVKPEAVNYNVFGVLPEEGWQQKSEEVKSKEKNDASSYNISLSKHFPDVASLNQALNQKSDTLLAIEAAFNKEFRWFYTYYSYSDTYHYANRLERVDPANYFTPEDFAFIDRLPREGAPITKADSIYLDQLNAKMTDKFASDAYFSESMDTLVSIMSTHGIEQSLISRFKSKRTELFEKLLKEQSEPDLLLSADTILGTKLSAPIREEYTSFKNGLDKRLQFMSGIIDGKFSNIIEMPGEIVSHNADSVVGSRLFYNPSPVKFLLKDYTLHAESRTINLWAVIVSVIFVLATVALLVRRSITR